MSQNLMPVPNELSQVHNCNNPCSQSNNWRQHPRKQFLSVSAFQWDPVIEVRTAMADYQRHPTNASDGRYLRFRLEKQHQVPQEATGQREILPSC